MKILLAITAFGISALLSTANSSQIKVTDTVEVDVRAYRATKISGNGPDEVYFNTPACRTTYLATNPNYVANGGAMVPAAMVFYCM